MVTQNTRLVLPISNSNSRLVRAVSKLDLLRLTLTEHLQHISHYHHLERATVQIVGFSNHQTLGALPVNAPRQVSIRGPWEESVLVSTSYIDAASQPRGLERSETRCWVDAEISARGSHWCIMMDFLYHHSILVWGTWYLSLSQYFFSESI